MLTNNRSDKTVKILDTADLAVAVAAVAGSGSVSRDGLTVTDATISNLGGNPVYARLMILIANGSELLGGVTVTDPVGSNKCWHVDLAGCTRVV